MIKKLFFYLSDSIEPYHNLAVEQQLLERLPADSCILYLWQNSDCIVIGRNQNPWSECATALLRNDNIPIVRRYSGGGAVYHDLGNLNYTFITSNKNYDPEKHASVIVCACQKIGIRASISGRNDILTEGQKFSGNAFYHAKGKSLHHGTLLIDVNVEKMTHYLTPSTAKLHAKGISSVRSRVINLSELCPDLTPQDMAAHILRAFEEIYGAQASAFTLQPQDHQIIDEHASILRSAQWIFESAPPFNFTLEGCFLWGTLQILLQVTHGHITHVAVYSDSLEHTLSDQLQNALTGCSFTISQMVEAIRNCKMKTQIKRDMCNLISHQDI